jgi:hypothetical protein
MSETEQNKEQKPRPELLENRTGEAALETDLSEDLPLEETKQPEITSEIIADETIETDEVGLIKENIVQLQQQKESLNAEIKFLEQNKAKLILETQQIQSQIGQMVQEGIRELEQKKQTLEIAIQKLERRQERVKEEMRTTFAGVSQDLAIRVQGFKDYLVGSLQDLATAAEQLELPTTSFQTWETPPPSQLQSKDITPSPQFAERSFQEETRQIKELLAQYRTKPDYYGSTWQLRRTFEPIHAERVSNWFFSQGGRGAIRSMGSRLQNILVASAIMSILYNLYGDRFRTLLLANTPERLGEWRRGLQDCLGISRSDFGPERGVVLFETPEALTQKADRIIEDKGLPLVIIDQTEDLVSLSLLQFPLWLAFVPEPQSQTSSYW